MSAAAPNPNNMIMLAVLGIGAYYVFSRRATAAPVAVAPAAARPGTPSQWAANDANLWNTVYSILGGRATPAQSANYAAANAATAASQANQPRYGSTAGDPYNSDGIYGDPFAVNPAPGSSFEDFFYGNGSLAD